MNSRLPDINTAFNTHRKRAIIAIEQANWTEALGALTSINGALPEEHQVIISKEKYQKLLREDTTAMCNGCKKQIDYNSIKILTVLTTPLRQFVTNKHHMKVWFCPQCKHENMLTDTKIEQTLLTQPYYLGVIDPPPAREDNLMSHITYDRTMERWCWTMLAELEHKLAEYRDVNWKRGDEENEFSLEVDTSWEDSDDSNS